LRCGRLRSDAENLVLRTERLYCAAAHDEDLVEAGKRRRAMCDDDGNAAARPHGLDSARQCRVALRIKVGVGFIEHNKERIAVERAGERDTLALASRQGCPPSPILVS